MSLVQLIGFGRSGFDHLGIEMDALLCFWQGWSSPILESTANMHDAGHLWFHGVYDSTTFPPKAFSKLLFLLTIDTLVSILGFHEPASKNCPDPGLWLSAAGDGYYAYPGPSLRTEALIYLSKN
jgi:hypothetical protein